MNHLYDGNCYRYINISSFHSNNKGLESIIEENDNELLDEFKNLKSNNDIIIDVISSDDDDWDNMDEEKEKDDNYSLLDSITNFSGFWK